LDTFLSSGTDCSAGEIPAETTLHSPDFRHMYEGVDANDMYWDMERYTETEEGDK
jgi:hypothetical protein